MANNLVSCLILLIMFIGVPCAAVVGVILFVKAYRQEADKQKKRQVDLQAFKSNIVQHENSSETKIENPSKAGFPQEKVVIGGGFSSFPGSLSGSGGATPFKQGELNATGSGIFSRSENFAPFTLTAEQRLVQLEDLKRKGLISQEEYSARRTKILSEI